MASQKGGQFLSLPSAARMPSSKKHVRHPGYSLFEWRKLCESGALSERQTLHVNLDDISKHNTEEDCWTAIRGKVYNVTKFLKYHPGRKAQLMRGAGIDCTELFDKVHSWVNEDSILKHCLVGYLIPGDGGAGPQFYKLNVTAIENVTHNTKLFVLANPVDKDLHVPAGHHVKIRALVEGEYVEREYTPIVHWGKSNKAGRNLLLMIKMYPNGKMTQHLSTLRVGDSVFISRPAGSLSAAAVCLCNTLVLIAAGTGLTPMISLLNTRYMQIHETHGQCSTLLLFANKREEDILWREQLEELCRLMPQCKVVHILSSSNESWKGETGTMSSSFLQKYLPEPRVRSENDVKICISGPLAFATSVCDILFRLGYSDDNVHSFD